MPEPVVSVGGLVKHFTGQTRGEKVHAVNDVTFSLYPGETLGLVGESGSGKTTIGRCVIRLLEPTGGTILFRGRDITHLPESQCRSLRGKIQIIFQDPYRALNPRMRVGRLINEMLMLHTDLDREARRDRTLELAERVRLNAALLTRFPNELSGGQLQRVCIARAVASNPELIVLDEPTSSLDLSVRISILELLRELQESTGAAMLFISHDLETLSFVSDRILVLYLGSIVESGPAKEVFERPAHPYTQSLLSAHLPADPTQPPQRHLLEGEVPGPINLPPGCPFEARCPIAIAECRQAMPEARMLNGEDHSAACIRIDDGSNTLPLQQ